MGRDAHRRHRAGAGLVCLLALLVAALPAPAQSSSPSYILQQSTTNAGGDASTSLSYRLTGSAAQETTIGTSSAGTRFVLQSGFWSFVGSGLVPVLLTVDRNGVSPDHVDLAWSGNNPPYTVFRSDDCGDVLSSSFDSTTSNDYADIPPLLATLECFNVLATAPGPAPPPGR